MSVEAIHLPSQTFRIGAVSRLTGITTGLIRMWERRYAVVTPVRTDTGNRLYTQEDIARLALIKQLVDSGDAIGNVASLTLPDLEDRVETIGRRTQSTYVQRVAIRVVAVGHAITALTSRRRAEFMGLELVETFRDTNELQEHSKTLEVDIVMIELPYITSSTCSEIEQLIHNTGASGVVVVYGFGSKRNVHRLHVLPVITLRAPADVSDLKRACLAASAHSFLTFSDPQSNESTIPSKIRPRRYNDEKLARIASLSTTIECECPHHLADLISCLSSFEQYSADCTSRNENDAAMHRYLHETTAKARSLLETALTRLIDFEGLEV